MQLNAASFCSEVPNTADVCSNSIATIYCGYVVARVQQIYTISRSKWELEQYKEPDRCVHRVAMWQAAICLLKPNWYKKGGGNRLRCAPSACLFVPYPSLINAAFRKKNKKNSTGAVYS